MTESLFLGLYFIAHVALIVRAITRPNRTPVARTAWVAVIVAVPLIGLIAYLAMGETSIGRERLRRLRAAEDAIAAVPPAASPVAPEHGTALSDLCDSVNGLLPVAGNRIELLGDPDAPPTEPKRDSDAALDTLIADIAAARDSVHLSFYLWLDDVHGGQVADTVAAAAARGVTCRVMVDTLGSRLFIRSPRWKQLDAAGVRLLATLNDIPRLGRLAFGRIDLRNHRKIAVIDGRIAYCGSQNCADPEFRTLARYAPWVDLLFRCEGPIVDQAQRLFASTWTAETGEDLTPMIGIRSLGVGRLQVPGANPPPIAAPESILLSPPSSVPTPTVAQVPAPASGLTAEITAITGPSLAPAPSPAPGLASAPAGSEQAASGTTAKGSRLERGADGSGSLVPTDDRRMNPGTGQAASVVRTRPNSDGVVAQMYGTGPETKGNAMSDSLVSALYAAHHELVITTPYLVPDEALLRALCAAPRRGVETTLIVPARNNSALVAAASRSVYSALLDGGVRIYEYPLGLLHSKSITIDARMALVGSANLDRRSLELNFENNLLVFDEPLTQAIRDRQLGYLSVSRAIEATEVADWPLWRRAVQNTVAMASPLL